jgi:hypothetical protein
MARPEFLHKVTMVVTGSVHPLDCFKLALLLLLNPGFATPIRSDADCCNEASDDHPSHEKAPDLVLYGLLVFDLIKGLCHPLDPSLQRIGD